MQNKNEFIDINTKTKKNSMIVLSTFTPIKHHNNTPFLEIKPKMRPKKKKHCQILKLQNENETKF